MQGVLLALIFLSYVESIYLSSKISLWHEGIVIDTKFLKTTHQFLLFEYAILVDSRYIKTLYFKGQFPKYNI